VLCLLSINQISLFIKSIEIPNNKKDIGKKTKKYYMIILNYCLIIVFFMVYIERRKYYL